MQMYKSIEYVEFVVFEKNNYKKKNYTITTSLVGVQGHLYHLLNPFTPISVTYTQRFYFV